MLEKTDIIFFYQFKKTNCWSWSAFMLSLT